VPLPKNPYTVVVGVDYSEPSREALLEAFLAACRHAEGEVHVVHVETVVQVVSFGEQVERGLAHPPLGPTFQRLLDFTSHELEQFNSVQRRRQGTPLARVAGHVRRDAPAEEIAQLAVDLDADLVVVGARGTTAIQRLTLGSVAHAVVALALCPVLIVRSKEVPANVPNLEPPCPRCVEVRVTSFGCDVWCDEHRAQHGQRRSYQRPDRARRITNSIFRN
jgi:nucleotide-binding universal stress UspA family protein